MKLLLMGAVVLAAAQASAQPYPAQPYPSHPGACYGRVALPGVYQSRTTRVLQAPGRMERRLIPAVLEHTTRRMLVRAAYQDRIRLPALYRVVSSSYVVAGPRRWERTQSQYASETERVLVAPGHWTWERRFGALASGPPQPGQTVVEPTGEILCKVWCPPRYEAVRRRVLVSPGRAYAVPTTVRRFVQHRVLVRPAVFAVRDVPAQYREVVSTRVIRAARYELVRTPPRYGLGEDRRFVAGGEGWAQVVCGGPLSHPAMQRMQASLAAQGYDPGPADGYGRPQTYAALRQFQMDRRMPAGQITVESARALGVVP